MPNTVCRIWYSLDVLFTSSTIIHLMMISIDRFMILQFPFKYGVSKRTRHTMLKIVSVWVLSLCIAGPLFVFSMFDTQTNVSYKGCGPETATFIISATVISFYLPLLIMTVTYALTVRALHNQSKIALHASRQDTYRRRALEKQALEAKKEPKTRTWSISSVFTRKKRRDSVDSETTSFPDEPSPHHNGQCVAGRQNGRNTTPATETTHLQENLPVVGNQQRDSLCLPQSVSASPSRISQTSESIPLSRMSSVSESAGIHRSTATGASTLRRKIVTENVHKGKRAVKVLGVLFAAFVLLYLPFFITYVIIGTCEVCSQYITPQMVMAFEWLEYCGSMVNPIIYHIFSPGFRRVFHKLMHCQYRDFSSTASSIH